MICDDDDDDEVRTAPWWIGFAFGMVFGGLIILMPVLITISNMRCSIFGFPVSG
jgi:hypothetical protein